MSKIRFPVLGVATVILLGAFSISGLSQDLLTEKVMSLEMAQTIAQAAIAKCRADNYHVAVTVLDGAGQLRAFLRDDGAGLQTVDVSHRKAYTALIMRRTSGEQAKAWAAMNPVPVIEGTIPIAGGVPIKVGNEVIGSVGVSGAPGGDKDEACASAGVAKVADKLK